jgi:DNA topoisomerase-6 subunit B
MQISGGADTAAETGLKSRSWQQSAGPAECSKSLQAFRVSAVGMYGQLTVGKPLHIISRIKGEELASEMYVSIDTAKNQPDIHRKKRLKWDRPHGTRVEMEMEGHYQKGPHSVEV